LLFVAGVFNLNAQKTKYNGSNVLHPVFSEKVIVSLVPVPLIFNGFRVDVDVRINDNIWLNIAPRINIKPAIEIGSKFIFGGGLDINARYYIQNKPLGFYVSTGLGAEYNSLGDNIKKTKEYYEITAIRFGGQTHVGYSFHLWSRCTMDIYAGTTFRNSINSFPNEEYKGIINNKRPSPFSYYFSGVCFDGGIRIGITL
jgi:acetyltransferase-like isoleucine patch superfamily enzyme